MLYHLVVCAQDNCAGDRNLMAGLEAVPILGLSVPFLVLQTGFFGDFALTNQQVKLLWLAIMEDTMMEAEHSTYQKIKSEVKEELLLSMGLQQQLNSGVMTSYLFNDLLYPDFFFDGNVSRICNS